MFMLSGCAKENQISSGTSSVLETSEIIDEVVIVDDSKEKSQDDQIVRPGVWWSVSDDYTIKDRYYYFDGNNIGSYLLQENGKGGSFTYSVIDNTIEIDFSDGEKVSYTLSEVESDKNKLLLSTDENSFTLTYQGNIDFSQFKFYSNEELIEMGKRLFLKSHDKLTPYIDAEIWQDGSIALHFYYIGETNTATLEWYIVDRFTAKGKDITEKDIDLTEVL